MPNSPLGYFVETQDSHGATYWDLAPSHQPNFPHFQIYELGPVRAWVSQGGVAPAGMHVVRIPTPRYANRVWMNFGGGNNLPGPVDTLNEIASRRREEDLSVYYTAPPDASIYGRAPNASFAFLAGSDGQPLDYVCYLVDPPDSRLGRRQLRRCLWLAYTGVSLHDTPLPSLFSYNYRTDDLLSSVVWPWDAALVVASTN